MWNKSHLHPPIKDEYIVSAEKTPDFKRWLAGEA